MGPGLLRLATALVRENAALERENATLRDRIAELERSAALDGSTTSSKPPASDGLRKKSGTQRRTRSQRRQVRQAKRRPAGPQGNDAGADREPGPCCGS